MIDPASLVRHLAIRALLIGAAAAIVGALLFFGFRSLVDDRVRLQLKPYKWCDCKSWEGR